ncbi:succinyl-diaminopimelate desuccinylase [Microbacteriaceae bacterium SG_E_30_P1]|uniref:Succinyl-diaminopimelate desuccinylase n=1 Tax=Antiquaquibacter oligotrophicus TaxID=2880260 RepID=A0ABT6KMS6_9MICO|nr:ArgE/DapE family deacylase [Antiquaquibacter oligotrophicus]MDH6181076.1 succinyl-diaminopimelate desuccinylase [Antiquaquibacter oligotrophicus]UDF13226.1 ArgE/DapE family deacylase [Antiquaquibacter oligotrophicus]
MINVDTVIADTQKLIGIESTNPGVLEADVAEWLEQRLTGMGLDVARHEVQPGRDNLSVVIPGADRAAPRLVLVSHMDTVPIGSGWTRDPLGGEITDGLLYGRGACDMKAGLALTLGLLDALISTGTVPPADVVCFYTVDEEAPGMLGAYQLVEDGLLRPDDQILAPEPSGMRLRISQMGLRWLTLTVTGKMAHAGRAHLGTNAAHIMAHIVVELESAFAALPFDDDILGRPRFTTGVITGGVSTNVVPALCTAELDLRIVPPLVPEDAVTMVERVATDVIRRYEDASFEVEALGARRPPVRASDDSKIVRSLRSSYLAVAGREPEVGGADGHEAYTDSAMIAALTGSESSTVLGPGATDQAHTADEFVPVSDLELGSKLLWEMVRTW